MTVKDKNMNMIQRTASGADGGGISRSDSRNYRQVVSRAPIQKITSLRTSSDKASKAAGTTTSAFDEEMGALNIDHQRSSFDPAKDDEYTPSRLNRSASSAASVDSSRSTGSSVISRSKTELRRLANKTMKSASTLIMKKGKRADRVGSEYSGEDSEDEFEFSDQVAHILREADEHSKEQRRHQNVARRMTTMYKNRKVDIEAMEHKLLRKPNHIERISTTIFDEGFDVFSASEDELVLLIGQLVKKFQLEVVFNKEHSRMNLLCGAIERNYKNIPFHNFYHAFSVAHMACIFLLRNPYLAEALGKRYVLAFIVAALGHDIDHPGNDNRFEMIHKTHRAEIFHNESILENYHASKLLLLLSNDELNVFYLLTPSQQDEIRKFIVRAILATDLKHHNNTMDFLRNLDDLPTIVSVNKQMRIRTMKSILHACDLSAQCLDLPVAIAWEERIALEMEHQASLDRKDEDGEVAVPPYGEMPVGTSKRQARAGKQIEFIDAILAPLWSEVARLMPSMHCFYDNLTTTVRGHYEVLHLHGEEAAEEYVERHQVSIRDILKHPPVDPQQAKLDELDKQFEAML